MASQKQKEPAASTAAKEPAKKAEPAPEKKESQPLAEKPKNQQSDQRKELQKQQKAFQQAEKNLALLNEKKAELEARLAMPDTYSNAENFRKTEAEYNKVMNDWRSANLLYEQLFENVMRLEEGNA